MYIKRVVAAAAGLLLPCAVNAYFTTGYNGLTWTEGALRMNQIQVVGSHNSYHIESSLEERKAQQKLLDNTVNYWYSHPQLDIQLGQQQMRNLEIDVLADPEGGNYAKPLIRKRSKLPYDKDPVWQDSGIKVLHVPDADIHSVCKTLISCLQIIKGWMDEHPDAVPIPIMMELKTAEQKHADKGGAKVIPWDRVELLDGLDEEIRSVFGPEQLLTPDDVRRFKNETLNDSILKYGWPDLDSARGRIFFLMDNGPTHIARTTYKTDRPNLEGRVLFTNANPGDTDCAFQKLNEPTDDMIENIQKQVRANYWVRTRADIPMDTVLDDCSTTQRDNAFRSGAQIVSTDFQDYGMSSRWGCDYAARLPDRKAAICNPVNGPKGCDDSGGLEPLGY